MIVTVQFVELPVPVGEAIARPVADIAINGVNEAPLRCLIDSGALRVRLPGSIASALGVDLSDAEPGPPLVIGGTRVIPYDVEVSLACAGYEWRTIVSFCSPDFAGFGVAGLSGFFDKIHVCIDGYLNVVGLESHDDRLQRLELGGDGTPSTPS
jgi:hypothetical protein